MSLVVTIDIRCDWCGVMIGSTGCGPSHSRIAIDDAIEAAVELEQQMRGVAIPSPPGHQMHLCHACDRRGRPPASEHANTLNRKREAAEARRAKRQADA